MDIEEILSSYDEADINEMAIIASVAKGAGFKEITCNCGIMLEILEIAKYGLRCASAGK